MFTTPSGCFVWSCTTTILTALDMFVSVIALNLSYNDDCNDPPSGSPSLELNLKELDGTASEPYGHDPK